MADRGWLIWVAPELQGVSRHDPCTTESTTRTTEAKKVSNVAMAFVEDLEKFAEMAAMLVIGILLTFDLLTSRNGALAACLMFVVRPIAVYVATSRTS